MATDISTAGNQLAQFVELQTHAVGQLQSEVSAACSVSGGGGGGGSCGVIYPSFMGFLTLVLAGAAAADADASRARGEEAAAGSCWRRRFRAAIHGCAHLSTYVPYRVVSGAGGSCGPLGGLTRCRWLGCADEDVEWFARPSAPLARVPLGDIIKRLDGVGEPAVCRLRWCDGLGRVGSLPDRVWVVRDDVVWAVQEPAWPHQHTCPVHTSEVSHRGGRCVDMTLLVCVAVCVAVCG